jgi:hypothetical protein
MKLHRLFLICLLAALPCGCVGKITAPTSGPTAKVTVEVTNFAPNRSLTNVENGYFTISNADESWGGQQILQNDSPTFSQLVPAGEELTYIVHLMQGGGGFSSTCGVKFQMTLPENADLHIKFELFRAEGPEVIGCVATLYSGDKLIGTYKGSSSITLYKVKWVY